MNYENKFEVIDLFESTIANYSGSKYAVAVDSCTNALFLCCKYRKVNCVTIPKRTYPGVACSIKHAGGKNIFIDLNWAGVYALSPHDIIDGALRFQKDMYVRGTLHCLSFHWKKHLDIGRGGMILTDDKYAYEWLKRARFDGRREVSLKADNFDFLGWNMYMTPEQAEKGLALFDSIKDSELQDLRVSDQDYPDLSRWKVYT